MARKGISKGKRFDIFRRDGFTCQYCGRTPPDVVLQVDHIRPVADGGDNDPMNLVTACSDCNAGKSAKLLDKPQRPDADLAFLETQQELAELRRYQDAREQLESAYEDVLGIFRDQWVRMSGLTWYPTDFVLLPLLKAHGPSVLGEAIEATAPKAGGGYFNPTTGWVPYLRAVCKNITNGDTNGPH